MSHLGVTWQQGKDKESSPVVVRPNTNYKFESENAASYQGFTIFTLHFCWLYS